MGYELTWMATSQQKTQQEFLMKPTEIYTIPHQKVEQIPTIIIHRDSATTHTTTKINIIPLITKHHQSRNHQHTDKWIMVESIQFTHHLQNTISRVHLKY